MRKKVTEILRGKPAVILVDDNIEGAKYISWHSLLPFQGDLKELPTENENKMLLSLVEKGFFDVKKVWRKGDEIYLADGHQTILTLTHFKDAIDSGVIKMLRKSDKKPTDLIPCVFINAENEQDLADKLLLINSQYGVITPDGLQNFKKQYSVQDSFMDSVVVLGWDMKSPEWGNVGTSWSASPTEEVAPPPPPPTIPMLPPGGEGSFTGEKQGKDFMEYSIIFSKDEFDFWTALVNRVKTQQMFENNSEAVIHIAKQYDMYVGDL